MRKQICMVGAGRVGRLHTRNISERAGHQAQVAAICDPSLQIAETLAADYGIKLVCGSLEEALERGSFDGAVITTPTFTHRDVALQAMNAGLHIHLEKPMAMNLSECQDIAAMAERTGRSVQLGFMRRFDEDFVAAAGLLRGGTVGEPMIIKSMTHGPGLPPPWANDITTSNGMLAEVNSHDLDTVSWFANSPPVDVTARVSNFKGRERGIVVEHFYDTLVATITFQSGAIGSVAGVCPADYGYDSRVEVTCTKGMVQVGDTGPGGLATIIAGSGHRAQTVYPSWRDRFAAAYAREMIEFAAVLDGAPVRVGVAEGAQAVALVLAGTVSILEGRPVPLSEVTPPGYRPAWQPDARTSAR